MYFGIKGKKKKKKRGIERGGIKKWACMHLLIFFFFFELVISYTKKSLTKHPLVSLHYKIFMTELAAQARGTFRCTRLYIMLPTLKNVSFICLITY